jgi:4-amino-4-deoxy-L-arabinose transferase-like glycosyltransferase
MKYLFGLGIAFALFLRLYGLTSFPPSLYWEEVALGYDAYSILKTGKDHHGDLLPIVAFESFGDWKPSGYFYIVVPFIAIFGLNEWAVRLPTVIAGILLIIGTAKLAKQSGISPVLALAVGAISPWAIQFSRAGWEVMSASAMVVWANYLLLEAIYKDKIKILYALLSVFLFAAAMYTYHATRLLVPLQLLGLGVYFLLQTVDFKKVSIKTSLHYFTKRLRFNAASISILLAVFLVLLSPISISLGDATTSQRFRETSIFSDITVIEESNQLKELSGNTLQSRILYHRHVLFGAKILENFFSHLTITFLFLSGDGNLRHSLQFYGQLYHVELFFIVVGVYYWIKKPSAVHLYYFYWFVVAIIPASITIDSPHALRILPALPIFLLLIASGIEATYSFLKKNIELILTKKALVSAFCAGFLIVGVYSLELLGFWRYYSTIYPKQASSQWQYGYKEMIAEVVVLQKQYPSLPIYITREQGRPAMYYWFFTKTDPREVQLANSAAKKDQGEFLTFKNIKFIDRVDQISSPGIVASSDTFKLQVVQRMDSKEQSQITDLNDKIIWEVYTIQ